MKKILALAVTILSITLSACEYVDDISGYFDINFVSIPVLTHINGKNVWRNIKVSEFTDGYSIQAEPENMIYTNLPLRLNLSIYSPHDGSSGHNIPVGVAWGAGGGIVREIAVPGFMNISVIWRIPDGEWKIIKERRYLDNQQYIISGYGFDIDLPVSQGVIEIAVVAWNYEYQPGWDASRFNLHYLNRPFYLDLVDYMVKITPDITNVVIPRKIALFYGSRFNYVNDWELNVSFVSVARVTLLNGRRPTL